MNRLVVGQIVSIMWEEFRCRYEQGIGREKKRCIQLREDEWLSQRHTAPLQHFEFVLAVFQTREQQEHDCMLPAYYLSLIGKMLSVFPQRPFLQKRETLKYKTKTRKYIEILETRIRRLKYIMSNCKNKTFGVCHSFKKYIF